MNIGIVGARKYQDRQSVIDLLNSLPIGSVIITSGCKGVCTWAREAAEGRDMKVIVYAPDLEDIRAWFDIPKRYYERNKELVEACDLLHAFISQEDVPQKKSELKEKVFESDQWEVVSHYPSAQEEAAEEIPTEMPPIEEKVGEEEEAVKEEALPISEEKIEALLEKVVSVALEKVAREIMPEVAEKMIREQIDALKKSIIPED